MPELRPWRGADVVFRPQLERRQDTRHAFDRMLGAAASWMTTRVGPGKRVYRAMATAVQAEAERLASLDAGSLRDAAQAMGSALRAKGLRPELVARSFALTQVATARHLGFHHHPEQIMGGLALLEGRLVEMATGEGKTVTAALAAATMALARMPVHVVTVNDYLAERDVSELRPIYQALGLSVGVVLHGHDTAARRAAYACGVTYVANKELGFDYLRDRLGRDRAARRVRRLQGARAGDNQPVLGGLGFAIVDEADSALIDEARTPLIIAEPGEDSDIDHGAALDIARQLKAGRHFRVDPSRRAVELADAGRSMLADMADAMPGLWRYRRAREEIVEQALAAQHLFERDRHYILRNGQIEIVDEYTGRVAEGRRWERGLHELIEAKEGVAPKVPDRTAARVTYQSLFRRYVRLAGMSGTAMEHAAEFLTVYGLKVVRIPTHRPVRRECLGQTLFSTAAERWDAVADSAAQQAGRGRPVLIGTRSVAASEAVAAALTARGQRHTLLNARQDRHEATVIAQAGLQGRITVATNMAGRGTDIRLGPGVAERGGLHVIVTEFHESPRIDRQLIGRCARQGDPGSWQALVSMDDDLFCIHAAKLRYALAGWPSGLALPALRRVAQGMAETRHGRDRRALLATERASRRMLALVGKEVWL